MKTKQHVIDTDQDPLLPYSFLTLEKHDRRGKISIDPTKITLAGENDKGTVEDVLKKYEKRNPANGNILDYLLQHPELVPEEWNNYYLFFPGTLYRGREGYWRVPYARWASSAWLRCAYWLRNTWDSDCRVVLLDGLNLDTSVSESGNLSFELRLAKLEKAVFGKKK